MLPVIFDKPITISSNIQVKSSYACTKNDMKQKFKKQDSYCRLCNEVDESLEHVVNCGQEQKLTENTLKTLLNENIEVKVATSVASWIE